MLSSKAGGCGLNLIGANRLVMFDPDWYVRAKVLMTLATQMQIAYTCFICFTLHQEPGQ